LAPVRTPARAPTFTQPFDQPPSQEPQPASGRQQLEVARQILASGRVTEARQILTAAQRALVLRPVTSAMPDVAGTNWPATWVGRAIRSLDAGNMPEALRDIDQAIMGS
jgi:hypothetical protein